MLPNGRRVWKLNVEESTRTHGKSDEAKGTQRKNVLMEWERRGSRGQRPQGSSTWRNSNPIGTDVQLISPAISIQLHFKKEPESMETLHLQTSVVSSQIRYVLINFQCTKNIETPCIQEKFLQIP